MIELSGSSEQRDRQVMHKIGLDFLKDFSPFFLLSPVMAYPSTYNIHGLPFHLDRDGLTYHLDRHGLPYHQDRDGLPFHLDRNGLPFY